MQKFKNFPIFILALVASVLGLVLVQQAVLAVWTEPPAPPGSTNLNAIVFTPLTQDLDLSDQQIVGPNGLEINGATYSADFPDYVNSAGYCIDGADCINAWPTGGGSDQHWRPDGTGSIYYTTTTGSGWVGIYTSQPKYPLHVSNPSNPLRHFFANPWDPSMGMGAESVANAWDAAGSFSFMFGDRVLTTGAHSFAFGQQMTVSGSNSVGVSLGSGAATVAANNTMAILKGNLGLGTVAPNKKLHIYTSSSAENTNSEINIQSFGSAVSAHNFWSIYHDGNAGLTASEQLRFWNADAVTPIENSGNVLVLDNTGFVGINTTSPASQLHIWNRPGFNAGLTIQSGSYFGWDLLQDSVSGALRFRNIVLPQFNNNGLTVGYDGSIGIGAAFIPTTTLDITDPQDGDFANGINRLLFDASTGSFAAGSDGTLFRWSDATGIRLGDGSITLGKNSVATEAGGLALGSDALSYAARGVAISNTAVHGDGGVAIGADHLANGGTTVTIAATGDSGIGIGSDINILAPYSIGMGFNIDMTSTAVNSFGINLDPNTHYNVVQPNIFTVMGGNVGIGKIAPIYKLDVRGSMRVDEGDLIIEDDETPIRNYLQISTLAAAPIAGDCTLATRGRMVAAEGAPGAWKLYVCTDNAFGAAVWQSATLAP